MKWLIRLFFRTLRRIIGPIMLLINKITMPKGVQRAVDEQRKLNEITKNYVIYQFKTCPFCIKVRRELARQSLNIEIRDAQHNADYREQLLQGGGKIKVPCLRIKNRESRIIWLYESDAIIQHLHEIIKNVAK